MRRRLITVATGVEVIIRFRYQWVIDDRNDRVCF